MEKHFQIFIKWVYPLVLILFLEGLQPVFAGGIIPPKQDPDNPQYVKSEILIKFKDDTQLNRSLSKSSTKTGLSSIDNLNQKYQVEKMEKVFKNAKPRLTKPTFKDYTGKIHKVPNLNKIYKLKYKSDIDPLELSKKYAKDNSIEYAEPNYIAQICVKPNDPYFSDQWGLHNTGQYHLEDADIDAPEAWEVEKGDTSVIIGIIDTGVDWGHPDIMDNIISTGYDFVNYDNDAMDNNGHGTHVAGIVAATTDNEIGIAGVAWNCKILPVKVLQSNGYGTYSDVASGVTYAANNGAKVINLSLGGYAESYVLKNALENACSIAVIVASAGNDRTNLPFYPAAWGFVIGVGASDVLYDQENDIWYEEEAVFSNYGINADLYAPGVNICSTIPLFYPHSYSYASWNGTSMAAPFVTGTIALLHSHFPDWSNDLIHGQLINTSDEILSGEKLNVYNALITTSKPQLTLYSHTIIDTLQADDQNGIAGAGETIEMVFDIRNTWEQAYNVESTLSYHSYEDTSFITIIDSTANFGSISSYTHSKNETNPFKFYVKSNTPNNTNVYFDYKITCDNGVVVEETFNINVQRGFEVSGLINENIIWTKDKHYIVISNIIIDTGTTLTIEPGTEVRIDPNKSIIVKGTLNAVGTEIDSIVFTNNITSRWGTLSFQGGSTGILKYCRIESAGSGITAIGADSLLIQNNTICNNYVNGILFESTPQANIINNIIYSNLKCGIHTEYSNIKIKDNLIFNNLRGGIWYRGDPTIIGNTIYNNSGWGINSIMGSPTITGNVFYNNSDGSIYWRFGYAEIIYNTIFSNANRSLSFDNIKDFAKDIVKYNNIISNNYYAIYYSNDYSVPPNINATHNFWGTINLDSINALIWDIYDDYEVGMVIYEPIETSPIIDAPGFLYQVKFNPPPPLGCETDTFNLIFSKPMDISIQPYVTFGLSEPYIQHIIEGDWVDSTHWQGTYEFSIMTGDGINHLRVTTAKDCEGMEIPKDTRFSFVVDAMKASSTGFSAQAGIGKVDLSWHGQNMVDLMGYNIYRYHNLTDLIYSDPMPVNTSMITDTTYCDTSVKPDVHYHYMYTGISTDFNESNYSDPVCVILLNTDPAKLIVPETFELKQNYPNPFNASTTIAYQLPQASDVTMKIYNLLGQTVYTQQITDQRAGYYHYTWNGLDNHGHGLPSGLYIYQIKADEFVDSKKMILLK